MTDPRLTPARPDLAAAHLKGQVTAERFVEGELLEVAVPVLGMTGGPDPEGAFTTQLLLGERITVYETDPATQLAWGQSARDGYVGWVPRACLEPPTEPTHVVAALATHVYPEPNFKTRPLAGLPFLAALTVAGTEGRFSELAAGGYVPSAHLGTLPVAEDMVAAAERMLGLPYLWGGRSTMGLDCSALVQLAIQAAGGDAPRDSDMQETLGRPLEAGERPQRGDLIFWAGHVGIMVSGSKLLHANAHAMAVAHEPLADAKLRILDQGDGPITARRRLG